MSSIFDIIVCLESSYSLPLTQSLCVAGVCWTLSIITIWIQKNNKQVDCLYPQQSWYVGHYKYIQVSDSNWGPISLALSL